MDAVGALVGDLLAVPVAYFNDVTTPSRMSSS